ncbi:hypothetical protein ACU5P1_22425 [Pseudomonas plecoglossicida]|uniref:Uncharacterized protein n=1 Tax=Pseudomonas plecoglossicida TaxID=70775 RepID=A0AAD0VU50_PSEDL|nr:hypothetical protein [Pseudomonas plecoglossicida]AXM96581.1 hypothetical protein DVB73_12725 [Pseudomonas plecoglossicida]EPB95548.1 hypothetical protein L321_13189 [Pseudomonas plecoglossicida NB2011]QLB57328.1 hypothetical protein HAV28_22210 [Pseudomonas plecoglossicida]GLR39477.1 hypothetical protein GCM10011247_48760 [Pseudomonas plecoglossicida]
MSTSDNAWAETAEVFLGSLEANDSTTSSAPLPEQGFQPVYLSLFKSADGSMISGQSDWLITGKQKPASVFRFSYHSRGVDRLHFMITGSGEDHDKKMGISRNGYLGLYHYASVTDYIKLEPLHWAEDTLICRLRDHQGHLIGTHHDPAVDKPFFKYLRVLEGREAIFRITRIRG